MQTDLRLHFGKGDLLAIALIILMAAAVFLCFLPGNQNDSGGSVEIYRDGKLFKSYPLHHEAIVEIENGFINTVTISEGRAAITDSNCPGEDCVHSGWISSTGRSIVCLPNRVEVRIAGMDSEVDFAVR